MDRAKRQTGRARAWAHAFSTRAGTRSGPVPLSARNEHKTFRAERSRIRRKSPPSAGTKTSDKSENMLFSDAGKSHFEAKLEARSSASETLVTAQLPSDRLSGELVGLATRLKTTFDNCHQRLLPRRIERSLLRVCWIKSA